MMWVLLLLAWIGAAADEYVVSAAGRNVALSTRGTALRVRIMGDAAPIDESPMIAPTTRDAAWSNSSGPYGTGISVPGVGAIFVSSDARLTLLDAAGALLTQSSPVVEKAELELGGADRITGRGAAMGDSGLLLRESGVVTPKVDNTAVFVPWYYALGIYGALGVVDRTTGRAATNYLACNYTLSGDTVTWRYEGPFELYLMPARTVDAATTALFALSGGVPAPPLYALGFAASRWGWTNASYIASVVSDFREGQYPLDVIICDFEWFTNTSDYSFQSEGEPWYRDFGYYDLTFPDPENQIAALKQNKVRFGGIRKPRLGNSDLLEMARENGWLLATPEVTGYATGRNVNMSHAGFADWYHNRMRHYKADGVQFFWNDEGETDYFTFYHWQAPEMYYGDVERFFSLNRAFTPGMARTGAAAWTGDIDPTWDSLQETPAMIMGWGLAGMPLVACDVGGFTAETTAPLLTRWMQAAVFFPIMRVHSTLDATPHWPWLWGEPYASLMRVALDLRYRLLPYHYSLAHLQAQTGELRVARPLLADYGVATTDAWLHGDLLVAPVLTEQGNVTLDFPCNVFVFNSTETFDAGAVFELRNASLDALPVFARAGSIVVLGPPGIQSTDDLLAAKPTAVLEIHVYSGADASFVLVEDDGFTPARRAVSFEWTDTARALQIIVLEDAAVPSFKSCRVTLFEPSSSSTTIDSILADITLDF